MSGYQYALDRLNLFIDLGIISEETLKDAYFSNDITKITSSFINNFAKIYRKVDGKFVNNIYQAFDNAISTDISVREKGLLYLDNLIQDYALYYGIS